MIAEIENSDLKVYPFEVQQVLEEPPPPEGVALVVQYVPYFKATTLDEFRYVSSKGFACVYEPPEPDYECHKVAFLSSAHLSMLTATLLMGGKMGGGATTNDGFGMMLRVRKPTDPDLYSFPDDLQKVFLLLAVDDVEYVVFDRDVHPIDSLEIYPW